MARRKNEPELRPIIVKKIIAEAHGGHHGGAWKVAYADFVTAMMAFFLLMWLLGSTDEKKRKALADYFTPTLVEMRQNSAGSDGLFGGDSIVSKDNYPNRASQTGTRSITIPKDSTGGSDVGAGPNKEQDRQQFEEIKRQIEKRLQTDKSLKRLNKNIRFTETREGLRIELIDKADFAMFALATDDLFPEAKRLIAEVAKAIKPATNPLMVRGHTDALPFSSGRTMNNWMLSTARAEATRKMLQQNGVSGRSFFKIEGVSDREPYTPDDIYDPRNRRISITLGWNNKAR
ncbi:Flagellar motor rotation protein MotB [hydrothermal vent metagenome]|uniref:Flagellar motor rotation protein MotB n=1 Tax=hydrothermal vent metagenome TaxID=652676 RepID=A0A3B0RZC3_9ZZZZ